LRFVMQKRAALVGACGLALFSLAGVARARADTPQPCFDAALQGQKLERDGRLLEARAQYQTCAQASCPETVTKQCTSWVVALDQSIPTVTLEARDSQGHDLTDVTVTFDDGPSVEVGQGRDIPLNPGPHSFAWRRADGSRATTQAVLRAREKGRHLLVTYPSPQPPPPDHRVPWATYALAGAAVLSGGVFGAFAIVGHNDYQSFGCDTHCAPSQGDQVRREFVVADVALGVAVLSLGAAAWLFFASRGGRDPAAATSLEHGVVARFW
jgi:hypothetical protein